MTLSIGSRLGSYEIVALLGAGGMGEVYRAHDTHLNRDVALKVLLDSVVGDAEHLARFTREAHVLASLNHPHIAHLYGFEAGPPTSFLVMELVEGPTLAEVIARAGGPEGPPLRPNSEDGRSRGPSGPRMALNDVLAIARQIADALEAAHEQGIIHRDLKPANIKVRDDGVVKVLDFGLARTLDPGPGTLDAANSPTMTARATQMGMILGTAAYMAPEQAKGRPVDKRADIWAFGVVLHEMLTGRQLFDAEDVSETLAAVLTRDVNATPLPATVPARLRALVRDCLVRDPKQRLRDMGDARRVLDAIVAGAPDDVSAPATMAAAVVPVWRRALPWALAGALSVALAAVLIRGGSAPTALPAVTRLQIALPPGVELYTFYGTSVSISPDGKTLALVAVADGIRRVYKRSLEQLEISPVPGTDKAASVAFSPDGRQLLVCFPDTSLHRIRLADSLDEVVTAKSSDYRFAWLPNNRIVFSADGRLWMSADTPGAPSTQLTHAKTASTEMEMQPVAVAGGKAILFVSASPDGPYDGRIEALSLADGARTTVVERASSPKLTSGGDLLFLRDGVLVFAPFDSTSLKTTGEATPVLNDVSVDHTRAAPSGLMDVSTTGTLVYASTAAVPGDIVLKSRGREEQIVRTPTHLAANPRMSPTERRLVYEEIGNGLWIWDAERSTLARLAGGDSAAQFPIFTRDGRDIIFRTTAGMFRQQLDGGANPVRIAGSGTSEFPSGTTSRDAELLYTKVTAATLGDIYVVPLGGGTPRPLINTRAYEGGAELSPDGQWLAYVSNENGGVNEIFVTPYPSLSSRKQVSSGGGTQPTWNPKGLEILYRKEDKMMSVRLRATPAGPVPEAPKEVFSGRFAFGNGTTLRNFSMTSDGEYFVLVKQQSGASLNVVLNWFETFKRGK